MFSIKEIYRIGRGPSSSHTMGPEKACKEMRKQNPEADRFSVTLYGSLAKTGKGHRTDYAIEQTFGEIPVDIRFDYDKEDLPHPNTMEIIAYRGETELSKKTVCSVGGGAIEVLGEPRTQSETVYPETLYKEIEERCQREGISLSDYVKHCEGAGIDDYLKKVWQRMKDTIHAGMNHEGEIPGGLEIQRKAGILLKQGQGKAFGHEKAIYMMSAYAYAASEENASGEKMVTAPTCGASGVLPAVLYFKQQELGYTDEEIIDALATAGLIGNLIKTNASISGAECGCQAEIGSACAMAAAAFAQLKGFGLTQIECAAEIALEHHLGLTCDPVCGLVQIPCIERNAVAAMRAVDAVSLAEMLYEQRKISLDVAIQTMYETGKDLSVRYRETSEGGLAKLYQEKQEGGKR
ncbi:MAG: L-serine ammonia-lyase, iron-sulfur-dependent, subunit alpha [Clostridia bacterium]|nr:L-serine ammonia-lyase, iron-sulfur-dependent, subunit alpha [Clostridia bacterium]